MFHCDIYFIVVILQFFNKCIIKSYFYLFYIIFLSFTSYISRLYIANKNFVIKQYINLDTFVHYIDHIT
jgi:hypothetical protein